jgi:hypothetical protein
LDIFYLPVPINHLLCDLLTRQQNIASRHPRLKGIGRRNKLNSKKDSGQVRCGSPIGVAPTGMTKLGHLIAGLRVT